VSSVAWSLRCAAWSTRELERTRLIRPYAESPWCWPSLEEKTAGHVTFREPRSIKSTIGRYGRPSENLGHMRPDDVLFRCRVARLVPGRCPWTEDGVASTLDLTGPLRSRMCDFASTCRYFFFRSTGEPGPPQRHGRPSRPEAPDGPGSWPGTTRRASLLVVLCL
jgi:hypothetical protein